MLVIGHISIDAPESRERSVAAFRQGLGEAGFVEGRDVVIEYRWAQDHAGRLPELAADLVGRNVAAIVSTGGTLTAATVKAATAKIPVIFEVGIDPVQTGLVASLGRPGGNLTGVNTRIAEVWVRELEMITRRLPKTSRVIAIVTDPNPSGVLQRVMDEAQAAADAIGRKVLVLTATTPQDIDFPSLARQGVDALIVRAWPLTRSSRRDELVDLAARHGIPPYYAFRKSVEAGGLMSYGIDLQDSFRLLGVYTGRILKGERPAELPVQQATKFELSNLETVKARGLTVAPPLLARADGVIEWE
jgi:putative ABC transport system substrate-binding protein